MKITKAFFAVLFAVLIAGCAGGDKMAGNGFDIVCSSFPPYDFARNIARGGAQVRLLLPPGSDSHSYDPKPADIIAVQDADLFIFGGGESDEWVERILDSVDFPEENTLAMTSCVKTVNEQAKEGMEGGDDGEVDEHVWTSPVNAIKICEKITDILCERDSENAALYRRNFSDYKEKLISLDDGFRDAVRGGVRKTLVFGDRFPFRYLADEYGLDWWAAFPGCAEMTEPSAKTVCFLIDKVRAEKIPVVFYVEFSNGKICDTIAGETGAKPMLLHSCHNLTAAEFKSGIDYVDIMQKNIAAIKEALGDGAN